MLEIVAGQYISVTPYGAFYASADDRSDPFREALFGLLNCPSSPALTESAARAWCASAGTEQTALDTLYRLQSHAMAQGTDTPQSPPVGSVENVLPALLPHLSARGQALLADTNGFQLGSSGFKHESAEELAAMSADVLALSDRHAGLLRGNLGIDVNGWALVDASGASRIAMYPLHIAGQRFALIVGGRPQLHDPHFAQLVWCLTQRYGACPA